MYLTKWQKAMASVLASVSEVKVGQATLVASEATLLVAKALAVPVEVEALAQMARMNLILGNKDEGRTYLEDARSKVRDRDPMAWSRYLGVRGRFEWQDDDLERAFLMLERNISLENVIGQKRHIVSLFEVIC